jgi:hypothetical protein
MRKLIIGIILGTVISGGIATAATHYLITNTKQIKPSVLHQLKGNRGPRGYTGSPGPEGRKGDTGAQGPMGPAGSGIVGQISGSVDMPAVQSATTVPVPLQGNTLTTNSTAWIAGVASFPKGLSCAGAISMGTILELDVDGVKQDYLATTMGGIPPQPSWQSFGLSVPSGTHTLTATARASCSNGDVPMDLRMTVFGS